ncbi:hypothetical protein CC78DRAFT_583407 [Lojkania enalia]|uniref:Uncharacterized protein n=1 Tax=Lojkania enalia TaxID=147567 RepID=A0A9P4K5J3_9PLEO|nr:hypothetical protein CC78DRAFT_583407 [Didymosphaeria enalia]
MVTTSLGCPPPPPNAVFPGSLPDLEDPQLYSNAVIPGSGPQLQGMTPDVDRVRNVFEYPSTTRLGQFSTTAIRATPPGSPLPSILTNAWRRDPIPISAGSQLGYRTRKPKDTIFRRISAGAEPWGAFARPLPA